MKRHIVLDLDETLIHSFINYNNFSDTYAENRKLFYKLTKTKQIFYLDLETYDNKEAKHAWVVKRPGLDEFLDYICDPEHFDKVIVWSAGKSNYVHNVVDYLFDGYKNHPTHVFTGDNITFFKNSKDSSVDDAYTKPLSKIFYKFKDMNLENTLILDNYQFNFEKNKFNGITIPHFEPNMKYIEQSLSDECLHNLIDWFQTDEFLNSDDFRYLDKKNIFSSGTNLEKDKQYSPKKSKR